MMSPMRYDPTPPPDELVEWAAKVMPKIVNRPFKHPRDRPWWRTPPPPPLYQAFNFLCVCRKRNVLMQCYPCNTEKADLFIGQCPRCLACLWNIRDR